MVLQLSAFSYGEREKVCLITLSFDTIFLQFLFWIINTLSIVFFTIFLVLDKLMKKESIGDMINETKRGLSLSEISQTNGD